MFILLQDQFPNLMRKVLFACCLLLNLTVGFAQSQQRLPIVSVTPAAYTGQDYAPWLNDNLDSLVANSWDNNNQWVDITLQLGERSIVNRLSLYDHEGVFTDNPAYLYALNGNEKVYLGKFEGLAYNTFVELDPGYSVYADAIIIHKYSNNIPQKIRVFGQPIGQNPVPPLPEYRLPVKSVIAGENTGQDYSSYLTDNLDSLVPNAWENNFKYVDVTLELEHRSQVSRLSLFDFEGTFTDKPAYLYALKNGQRTFIGVFEGLSYHSFVDILLPNTLTADAIVIHKYCNNIPQKVKVYGQQIATDPIDTTVRPEERLKIKAIVSDPRTGMDFSSYLTDNTDSLVNGVWSNENFTYTDVVLQLEKKAKIGRISLYDFEGTFTEHPASIYAETDTGRLYLGKFEGLAYDEFVDLPLADSITATAIIIHKYGNDIPQKVKLYGVLIPGMPANEQPDVSSIVKIPVDPTRWFQLNNVANGLEGLFDGKINERVETGWGKILNNYDAYYPLEEGEEISITDVKFYDGEGSLGNNPLTLSVLTADGFTIPLAVFNGSRYNEWVGPHADGGATDSTKFKVDTVISNARYLVLNCWSGFPNELELYGLYKAPAVVKTPPVKIPFKLKNTFGVNAFEWDFESPYDSYNIDDSRLNAIKQFTGVRHYMDWEKLESQEGSYTYSPVHSGGWNYDAIYESCKAEGIAVLACLKTIPGWMQQSYPGDQRDAENVPARYGKDLSDPQSYIEQARMAFQYIARYGSNTNVDPSLLQVNSTPRWTNDDVNTIKVGMNVIKYIECDNERDKWWKGRKAYQTAFEYAANLSAFYDGHKHTMGPGVGVKNADPNVQVVMGGIADPNPGYLRGMIEWCRIHRGYLPDGKIDLCWDVINYHLYSNDAATSQGGNASRGAAPEVSKAAEVATSFIKMAHEYANGMPVWVSELGYDLNQGSPLKAIPIGNKSEYQTQADWILRSALLYARSGVQKVFFYQLYDDNFNNPVQFGSMGLLNEDRSRRPAADFLLQTRQLLGEYSYKETLNNHPLVDHYELDGKDAYALMVPGENGGTVDYTLHLNGANAACIYTPKAGRDTMEMTKVGVTNGELPLTLTETPIFVIPEKQSSPEIKAANALRTSETSKTTISPNPSAGEFTLHMNDGYLGKISVQVVNTGSGNVYKQFEFIKTANPVLYPLELRAAPDGVYMVVITAGSKKMIMKILKAAN